MDSGEPVPLNEWQSTAPDKAGWWEIRCMETDQTIEHVEVADRNGILWVKCVDLGWNPVSHYHGGLTEITWRWSLIQERVFRRQDLVSHVRLDHLGDGEILDIRGEDGQWGRPTYDVMWFGIGARLDKYDADQLKLVRQR